MRRACLLQELGDDGFGPRRAGLREGPNADFALFLWPLLAERRESVATRAAPAELVAECFAAAAKVAFFEAARRLGGYDGDSDGNGEKSH